MFIIKKKKGKYQIFIQSTFSENIRENISYTQYHINDVLLESYMDYQTKKPNYINILHNLEYNEDHYKYLDSQEDYPEDSFDSTFFVEENRNIYLNDTDSDSDSELDIDKITEYPLIQFQGDSKKLVESEYSKKFFKTEGLDLLRNYKKKQEEKKPWEKLQERAIKLNEKVKKYGSNSDYVESKPLNTCNESRQLNTIEKQIIRENMNKYWDVKSFQKLMNPTLSACSIRVMQESILMLVGVYYIHSFNFFQFSNITDYRGRMYIRSLVAPTNSNLIRGLVFTSQSLNWNQHPKNFKDIVQKYQINKNTVMYKKLEKDIKSQNLIESLDHQLIYIHYVASLASNNKLKNINQALHLTMEKPP